MTENKIQINRAPVSAARAASVQERLPRAAHSTYFAPMRRHESELGPSSDPITKLAVDLAESAAERSRMNKDLLIALAHAVGAIEEKQQRFRNAVFIRLSKVETTLTEIQGAQLASIWPPGQVSDDERTKRIKEVEERMEKASKELGIKMVRYLHGESEQPVRRHDGRRKWSDWEI